MQCHGSFTICYIIHSLLHNHVQRSTELALPLPLPKVEANKSSRKNDVTTSLHHHVGGGQSDYLGWVVTTGQGESGWSMWIAGSGSWWGWPDAIVWWPDAIVRSKSSSSQLALALGWAF